MQILAFVQLAALFATATALPNPEAENVLEKRDGCQNWGLGDRYHRTWHSYCNTGDEHGCSCDGTSVLFCDGKDHIWRNVQRGKCSEVGTSCKWGDGPKGEVVAWC